jgi:nuclear transport factor 2 (NTF2) superfamily protein
MNTTAKQWPTPPWDMETAAARLQLLENDFNSTNPEVVIANFSADAEVRFGLTFFNGRAELSEFLAREFAEKSNYQLKLDLWGALKGRMAVRSELKWNDAHGRSFRNYGVQVFQFDDNGFVQRFYLSFNDERIA